MSYRQRAQFPNNKPSRNDEIYLALKEPWGRERPQFNIYNISALISCLSSDYKNNKK